MRVAEVISLPVADTHLTTLGDRLYGCNQSECDQPKVISLLLYSTALFHRDAETYQSEVMTLNAQQMHRFNSVKST